MFLIVFLYFVLSIIFLLCKISVTVAKPLFFVGVRMVAAGGLMLAFEEWRHGGVAKLFGIHKKHLPNLALLTFFHAYLAFVPEFLSIPHMSSIKLNLLWALSPFVAALLSFALYKERLSWMQISGICIAFSGMLPDIFAANVEDTAQSVFLLPELGIVISMVSAAYAWFIFKKLLQSGVSMIVGNGFAMLMAGPAILATSFFYEGWHDKLFDSWFSFLIVLVALLLISNVFFYNLYGYLLGRYSITFLTVAGFLAPLFGAVLGWIFLGEAIKWTFFVAAAGVAVGLYLFTQGGAPQEADTELTP